jgi:hypothetical protein
VIVRTPKRLFILAVAATLLLAVSCIDSGDVVPPPGVTQISSDAGLFRQFTETDPFTSYTLFPNADSVTSGTLNGSHAHRPLVRVSMNSVAIDTLQSGSLPAGASFPAGSTIVKQIIENGETSLFAVMHKDPSNPLAGNGWLWGEYYPDGRTFISMTGRGSACTACHALEQGPHNDFVRTFERQR